MIELEQELIGACLNTPSAAEAATGVLPEHFSDPYLGEIWARIKAAGGKFTVRTIAADLESHPGYEATQGLRYLAAMCDQVPYDFDGVEPTSAKLLEGYRKRQALVLMDQQQNAILRGEPVDRVLEDFKPRIAALANVGVRSSRFKPLPVSEFKVQVTPWLIKGVMPTKGIGFAAGASGAGKSFLALDMTLSLAAGKPTILARKAKRCGVIYIAAEDFEGCKGRVRAWQIATGHTGDLPFEMIGGGVNLLDQGCVDDLCRALADASARFADSGVRLGVVVVDTLARCLPGADENSGEDMSMAVGALEAMASVSGAFVLAVAHHGKSGTSGGIRGWSGMNAASDMTLTVERSEDDPTLRMVTLSKVKNGIDGDQYAFRLKRVGLQIDDEDGDELDSCVCEFESMPDIKMPARRSKLPPQAEIALKAVKYCTDNFDTFPVPPGAPRAPWSRAVDFMAVKNLAIKNGFMRGRNDTETHSRFSAALERLVSENHIRMDFESDRVWLI